MGKHFGNLQKLSGVTYYVISPHEVRTFSGVFNPGIKNTIRRFRESFLWFFIPTAMIYTITDLINKEHDRSCRKDPRDYVNDE